jgi:hypothetical protein
MEAQGAIVKTRGMFYNTCMGVGQDYALINVKHSNAILEYLIMCINVGECRDCSWTIYYKIPILTYEYMQM